MDLEARLRRYLRGTRTVSRRTELLFWRFRYYQIVIYPHEIIPNFVLLVIFLH